MRKPSCWLLVSLFSGALAAQSPQAPIDLRTPDGSRFLLLPTGGTDLVHWSLASPAGPVEDPLGHEGLSIAVLEASMAGTWRTGSKDPAAEQRALAAFDRVLASGGTPNAAAVASAAAAQLNDSRAYLRVLAAAPAIDVVYGERGGCGLVTLTTTNSGLERVAALLVERREQNALRTLQFAWQARVAALAARGAGDPLAGLRAEAWALAFPGHPLGRMGERSATVADRDKAAELWLQTQRPDRTVHVLTGRFDPTVVQAMLNRTFAVTALASEAWTQAPLPRPLAAERRSSLPGVAVPACVIGWRLRGDEDPEALAQLALWLASGPESCIGRAIRAQNLPAPVLRCVAPSPVGIAGGLLLVEAVDPSGRITDLADQCLRAVAAATTQPTREEDGTLLQVVRMAQWQERAADARSLGAWLAVEALVRPTQSVSITTPSSRLAELPALLARILANGQPVVVEGRKS